jgi:hypothetical protein
MQLVQADRFNTAQDRAQIPSPAPSLGALSADTGSPDIVAALQSARFSKAEASEASGLEGQACEASALVEEPRPTYRQVLMRGVNERDNFYDAFSTYFESTDETAQDMQGGC